MSLALAIEVGSAANNHKGLSFLISLRGPEKRLLMRVLSAAPCELINLTKAVICEVFNSSDINQIVLGVREGNIPATQVYEQAGFETYHSKKEGINSNHDGFQMMTIYRHNLKPEL